MTYTELSEIEIFRRFPNFIPFVGDKYADAPTKLLLVWESYYDTKNKTTQYDKNVKRWYEEEPKETIDGLFSKMYKDGRQPHNNHWNFASKMHKNGIDRGNPTFKKIAKVLPFEYCAGYNYYLRPATNATSIKTKALDNEVAADTLQKIIETLKPNFVLFFSKKSYEAFGRKEYGGATIEKFVHPASAWWNKGHGKPKQTGKERFEEFCQKHLSRWLDNLDLQTTQPTP